MCILFDYLQPSHRKTVYNNLLLNRRCQPVLFLVVLTRSGRMEIIMSIDASRIEIPPRLRMDCYRYSLYPILKYYHCNADLLLLSENTMLRYRENLTCDTLAMISISDLLYDFKIDQTVLDLDNERAILRVLKYALDHNCFAICLLDAFYYSPFRAVYGKAHTSHGIPIYGYSEKKGVFYSIDSNYLESYERIFVEISYEDVINGIIGYKELKKAPAIQLLIRNDVDQNELLLMNNIGKKYIDNFIKKINIDGYSPVNEFSRLCNYLDNNSKSEKEMVDFSIQCYKYIDQFINARMLEYYGMPRLFDNIDHLNQIDMLTIEKCNFIRAIMYRTVYTREYRLQSFKRFSDCFQVIADCEKERLDFIHSFQWEKNIKGVPC